MTVSPVSATPSAQPVTALRAWAPSLIAILIATIGFGIAFQPEIAGAILVWNDSTAYNHCYLVLPLAGAMLWSRRGVIAALRPQPMPAVLALIPLLSGLWMAAAVLDVLEAQQLIIVMLFEILLLATLGWRTMRTLLAPLLFLVFLVPFGAFLVPWLQAVTVRIVTYGLQLLNIPAYIDGLTIEIPEGTFEIAEACAGLRFLIASIVFGCFFATMMYQNLIRRALFIGLSVVVPIIANGIRALGIIVLGHIKGSATAALTDHVLYGWIFFSVVILILIAVGMSFSEHFQLSTPESATSPPHLARRVSLVMATGLALALLGPAYLALADHNTTVSLRTDAFNEHGTGEWTSEPDIVTEWRPDVVGAQRQSLDVFRNNKGAIVTQFIGIYYLRARNSALTKTTNHIIDGKTWRLAKEGRQRIGIAETSATVNSAEIFRGARRRLVWWFYIIDDQVIASVFEAKLLQARAILLSRAPAGAFIAISTEVGETQPGAEALTNFVTVMAPIWGLALRPIGPNEGLKTGFRSTFGLKHQSSETILKTHFSAASVQ
jgi:exosortase A